MSQKNIINPRKCALMYAITYFDVDSALFICGHGAHELGEREMVRPLLDLRLPREMKVYVECP